MEEIDLVKLQQEGEQIVQTIQTPLVIVSDGQPKAILMSCECFDLLAEALLIVDDLERVADQAIRVCEA